MISYRTAFLVGWMEVDLDRVQTIKGKKYDRSILKAAEIAVKGGGDGRKTPDPATLTHYHKKFSRNGALLNPIQTQEEYWNEQRFVYKFVLLFSLWLRHGIPK